MGKPFAVAPSAVRPSDASRMRIDSENAVAGWCPKGTRRVAAYSEGFTRRDACRHSAGLRNMSKHDMLTLAACILDCHVLIRGCHVSRALR